MGYKHSTSLFIGETTGGIPLPVFWDSHTPVINNKPPGTLITGAPGSGKTFLALTVTAMSTILGKTTVVLDPKGDFLSLVDLKDQIGRFAMLDLTKGKVGLLDPFYMTSDDAEKVNLVIEVIDIFVGGLTGEQLTVLSPIVKDVTAGPNPSLQKVVDELRGSTRPEARDLGTQLDLFRKMKFAKLCFAPGNTKRQEIEIGTGLTVFALTGLLENMTGEDSNTRAARLASGILFLLTDFLRRLMMNDESGQPKTVVIDEAHAVLSTSVGARTIKSMALLGRSKFLSLILITQNNSHLQNLDIENTISTRFAFRSTRDEASKIIEAMDLPTGEGFEDIILSLETGECLMRDFDGRYASVQISAWKQDWKEAFNSNPLDRIRKRKAAEAEAAKKAMAAG